MNKTRKTKIVATIGPASRDKRKVRGLIKAGADIFRFNLKHGSLEEHLKMTRSVKDLIKESGKKVEILLDFPAYNHVAGFELAQELAPEYIALSYIKNAQELEIVRNNLKLANIKSNIKSKLVCKIETEESLKSFSNILKSTDMIMVARGDLGRSVELEYVPIAQKEIISYSKKKRKAVIVATEMLLSMTESKKPSRAEASDVANAVLDGASAVMLSEETAIGKYPINVVETMDRIVRVAEYWQKKGHISIPSASGKSFYFGRN